MSEEPKKIYFSYNDIHQTIKDMAGQIKSSGYDPQLMVAIGTGGFIPARILKTFLDKPIFTVGISYYDSENNPKDSPQKIQWIDEVEKKLQGKRILLVDEVDDSRVTLEYCLRELLKHQPAEIAVAVLHNKRKEKRGEIPREVEHYFYGLELEDAWICYPWDADDILEQDRLSRS
ncbi:MAG TPA: phosphoribosyltransferase [Sediminispirochaeta sp.]|nr:phosphoribosyltransferase [Sediminispirochaeta sp.]